MLRWWSGRGGGHGFPAVKLGVPRGSRMPESKSRGAAPEFRATQCIRSTLSGNLRAQRDSRTSSGDLGAITRSAGDPPSYSVCRTSRPRIVRFGIEHSGQEIHTSRACGDCNGLKHHTRARSISRKGAKGRKGAVSFFLQSVGEVGGGVRTPPDH